jgi:uncharacterized spore protein YtfJ
MKYDELVAKTKDSLEARMVYTEPYEKNGITVIAAARIAGGGGGGNGKDKTGQEGEGSGFGLTAKPTGAYVIKDGKVRWEPAVDVNRLLGTIGAIVVAALFFGARIVKIRARLQSSAGQPDD